MKLRGLKLKKETTSRPKHQRRLPAGPVLKPSVKEIHRYITLHEKDNDELRVSFDVPPEEEGDDELDLRVHEDLRLIFHVEKSDRADWEFSHPAGVTLAYDVPPAPDLEWHHNYSMVPPDTDDDARCKCVQIEAKRSFRNAPYDYKYNLKFVIYKSPDGNTYAPPKTLFIDPDIKNPGDYGVSAKRPKRDLAKSKVVVKRKTVAKKRR